MKSEALAVAEIDSVVPRLFDSGSTKPVSERDSKIRANVFRAVEHVQMSCGAFVTADVTNWIAGAFSKDYRRRNVTLYVTDIATKRNRWNILSNSIHRLLIGYKVRRRLWRTFAIGASSQGTSCRHFRVVSTIDRRGE